MDEAAESAQAPATLEYLTPGTRRPVRAPREPRVTLGCLVSFLWLIASLPALSPNWPPASTIVLFPLGWLALWLNLHYPYSVPLTPAIVANSVFWGFLIAFAMYRRRWWIGPWAQ